VSVSIDFLSGLYNRHSCYADRLSPDQLTAIHVPTPVETALQKWIKAKRDVVLTGNPGDGKTFLLRRLESEVRAVKGDQILDATAEKDYGTVVARWRKARKAGRPFFLAINHGPLNRLLQLHASTDPMLGEVRRQLDGAVYYGSEPPKAPKDVIVLDLNLRSVLSRGTIEAALDNLLREHNYQECSYFKDETTCGSRNRNALLNPQVRERLVRLLSVAGYTTRHVSMRDLQGFLSYLIFGGASCAELSKHEREGFEFRYYNLCFAGDGELFRAVNELFDPVRTTVPEIDEHLWENTGVFDGWVFVRPPLTPDHYEDAWDQFRAIKRQYYFEHRDGGSLLDLSYEDDRVFQELVSSKGDTDQKYLGTVLEAINRFYCQALPDEQEYLRLWGSQVYDTHTPPVLVSCYRVDRQKFSLDTPQLAPWLREAIEFKPGHLILRYRSEAGETGLRIDRGLWKALMLARRGIPMGLRSPQYSQLLQSLMTRLHRHEAQAVEIQNVVVFNSVRDRVHEVSVDRTKGRYIAR
jgi:hypothetical protein